MICNFSCELACCQTVGEIVVKVCSNKSLTLDLFIPSSVTIKFAETYSEDLFNFNDLKNSD